MPRVKDHEIERIRDQLMPWAMAHEDVIRASGVLGRPLGDVAREVLDLLPLRAIYDEADRRFDVRREPLQRRRWLAREVRAEMGEAARDMVLGREPH